MAYNTKYLGVISQKIGNNGFSVWSLETTDAIATVNTDAYISDGVARGMKQGDEVTVRIRASLPAGAVSAIHKCWVIDTDGTAVDLTDGLAVTATNTD